MYIHLNIKLHSQFLCMGKNICEQLHIPLKRKNRIMNIFISPSRALALLELGIEKIRIRRMNKRSKGTHTYRLQIKNQPPNKQKLFQK